MNDMPVRIMQFEFDAEELKKNIPDGALNLGLSMTLPYIQPYVIRTMREGLKHTKDKEVAAEVKQFIGQEAQHFRQHRMLNDLLRDCYPALAGLQEIEDQMEADFRRFTKTKSLKFNLAYAEGFEAAICATARTAIETIDINAPMSDLSRLFIWHLTEEIEHRTVSFNVYKHLFGDYFYRVIVGMYGQYHFFKYVFKFAHFIAKHSPPKVKGAADSELKALGSYSLLFLSLGKWLGTLMPWYNPAKLVLPSKHGEFAKIYSELALETRG